MIGKREARYCNLKLLLTFLVVYGHMIEKRIGQSPGLLAQYRWIYAVHMPLFVFLSGLFLKEETRCLRQGRRMLLLYLCLQAPIALFSGGGVSLWRPYWHLWYLLSLSCWSYLAWLWLRLERRFPRLRSSWVRVGLVVWALGAACGVGFVPWVGRGLSLSRTVVFLPFFLCGLFCPRELPWRRLRLLGLGGLALAAAGFFLRGREIPTALFYQAEGYGGLGAQGAALRLLTLLMGAGLSLFLLTFVPERRLSFSKLGTDTMGCYLLHAPLVLALRAIPLPDWSLGVVSMGVVCVLYKALQWRLPLYAVTEGRERDDGLSGNLSGVRRAGVPLSPEAQR